jgi:hypothetical protein
MDEFRWLEDGNDPAVKAWTHAQNRRTRSHLDTIESRAGVFAQLTALFGQVTPSYGGLVARPGGLFAFKFQPPKQQRLLVILALASAADPIPERILLDPNELEPKGHVAIDWFVPSPDGKLVAVCLSEYASEEGTLHFYHTETGLALPDRIPRVQYPTGGGSAAWEPDGSGVFYTRYPHPEDRPCADLRFHQQILPLSPGAKWHLISCGLVADRRERRPGQSGEFAQNGRPSATGQCLRQPDPRAAQLGRGPRHGHRPRRTHRRKRGCPRLSLQSVGDGPTASPRF